MAEGEVSTSCSNTSLPTFKEEMSFKIYILNM